MMDNFEFGAIVQKVKVKMPAAKKDDAYDLVDGSSVDPWIISKPKARQNFFSKRTPYSFFITIQEEPTLQEAFTSADVMGAFIAAVFGEMQNRLELTAENLARLTMANYMAHLKKSGKKTQVYDLVTMYNAETGKRLTAASAKHDSEFLRYAVGIMSTVSEYMSYMSTEYNAEGEERHTPLDKQFLALTIDFESRLKRVVLWEAFNKEFVSKAAQMSVPYWQAAENRESIDINIEEDGESVKANNIIGFLFDREALGALLQYKAVRTTNVNARALYYNTWWHQRELWFNDLSENAVLFTLN